MRYDAGGRITGRERSDDLMRAQLDRLSAVTALANVTLGVIPLGAEVAGVGCDHSFNILDAPKTAATRWSTSRR